MKFSKIIIITITFTFVFFATYSTSAENNRVDCTLIKNIAKKLECKFSNLVSGFLSSHKLGRYFSLTTLAAYKRIK